MKAAIIVATYLSAVAVFIAVAGYEEWSIVSDGMQIQDDATAPLRPPTQQEVWEHVRFAAFSSVPVAFIGSLLLLPVAVWVSRLLRNEPLPGAILFSALAGVLGGGLLSFIVYAVVGGWGPPFFRPTTVTGALLFAVAAWRQRHLARASASTH